MEESKTKVTACLTQIYGENTSKKYKLKCSEVTIGRSFQAEIRLKNPNVSRNHCTLFYSNKEWKVRDNKSQNGTYVNGQKLQPGELHVLQCGDIIFLGPPSEMPEAFCYDDAFLDEEIPDNDCKLESQVPPSAKRPAEHEIITTSKRKSSSNELPDKVFDAKSKKIALPSVNNGHSKEVSNTSKSTALSSSSKDRKNLPNTEFKPKNHPSEKIIVHINLPLKSPFHENNGDSQNVHDDATYESAMSSSMQPHRNELTKLREINDEHQINEISSTADQAEDSQSLIDNPADSIPDPFYNPSCSTEVLKEQNSDSQIPSTPEDTETLKSKLALMSEKIKMLEKSKSDLLKNYNDVCAKNKTLDEQLAEQKKVEDQLKNYELKAKDAVKNELLEKFEEDLICNICTELFIKPTVLDCSHTFCQYCIKQWRKKKNDCPICRRKIQTMTPVLTLEHFIEKALSTLTPEQRDKRLQLIKDREKPPVKVPTPRRQKRHRRFRRRPTHVHSPIPPQHDVEIIAERRNPVLPLPLPNISLQLPVSYNDMIFRIPDVALLSESDGDSFNIYIG